MFGYGKAIWRYRHFISASIKGELKGRFARSRVGALWFILHPLAQAMIYTLVLSEVLGAKIGGVDDKAAYSIYLMAGIASWGLFSEITNRCLTIFLEYGPTLKKIMFPRICLPIIIWGSALLNHLILLSAMAIIFVFYGHFPTVTWLVLPLGILVISAFGFGLGVLTGVLNVFSRDVAQVMGVVMNLWFWLTPIVYTADIVPEGIKPYIGFNPMTSIVKIYQDAILFNQWPDWHSLAYPIIVCFVLLVLSLFLFRKASPELVDVL